VITKTCLVFAASALVVGVAAAQTLSGLTGNDREPPSVSEPQMQLTRPQIDRQENNGASRGKPAVQLEIDSLYREIRHAVKRALR